MTLAARTQQAVGDAVAAERWLDEGGSFSRPVGQPMTGGTLIAPSERLAPAIRPASRAAASVPRRSSGHG